MKIRHIDLGEHPVLLAPMEDVTDPAFRLMCKKFGADMVYTEFVSADALIRSVGKTMQKLNINDEERPVAIQIYGKDTATMVEAAKIVEEARPDILDINFGCPVKRVAGKGAGAGMLQNIPLMLEITRAVVDAVKIPVTVKTRLGWDNDHKIIVSLAEQLQDCGIEALTIHGRTRAQMYTGEADWTLIGEVKKNPRIHIPVIGNGDVTTPQRAKECFDLYGVDAIMIGRASFGRPWIFKEVKHYIETGEELPPLSFDWKMDVLRREVSMVLQKNVLFSGTILDNLRWGDENASEEECIRVAKLACADEFIERFPDKYNTWIEQGGSNVSGGQKQRLTIARALLRKPKVLILDDSTSAVDTATDAKIRKAFREEIPGTTKIIIAQRISSVQDADRILVLDNGKIDGLGTHEELLKTNAIYQEVYNSQTQGSGDFDKQGGEQ